MSYPVDVLRQRIADTQERIARAAEKSGRSPADVMLVAVSKTHPAEAVRAAYQAGLRHFGENRVEEGEDKIQALRADMSDATWHMIGHIQSRKSASVAEYFDWVHSLDRLKVARRLSAGALDNSRELTCLLEVNVSGEETKSGFDLVGWQVNRSKYDLFVSQVVELVALGNLVIEGLMTMAPFATDPESVRPVFQELRLLRDALQADHPDQSWSHLSMGMSGDFEVAVEEGATIVRLGTRIFGSRRT